MKRFLCKLFHMSSNQLLKALGKRLYLTEEERQAFMQTAFATDHPLRALFSKPIAEQLTRKFYLEMSVAFELLIVDGRLTGLVKCPEGDRR